MAVEKETSINPLWLLLIVPAGFWIGKMIKGSCNCGYRDTRDDRVVMNQQIIDNHNRAYQNQNPLSQPTGQPNGETGVSHGAPGSGGYYDNRNNLYNEANFNV